MRQFSASLTKEDQYLVINVADVGVTQAMTVAEADDMARDLVRAKLQLPDQDFELVWEDNANRLVTP